MVQDVGQGDGPLLGRIVWVVMEAKASPQALTSVKRREELTASRDLREASVGLGIAPDAGAVPGGGMFAKIGERLFVVVADNPLLVAVAYLAVREVCALAADRHGPSDTVQVAKAEARISQALAALSDLDVVTRHGNSAAQSLQKILEVTADIKTRVEDALRESLGALGNR